MTPSRSRSLALALLVGLLWLLVGCRGDKIATVSLAGPGVTGETTFTTSKPVSLWSDWDAVWKGRKSMDFPLTYQVEVLQDGVSLGTVTCDTKSSSEGTCAVGADMKTAYRSQCEVRMKCEVPAWKAGAVTLRITGKVEDVVNTKEVTKMSVNVRER